MPAVFAFIIEHRDTARPHPKYFTFTQAARGNQVRKRQMIAASLFKCHLVRLIFETEVRCRKYLVQEQARRITGNLIKLVRQESKSASLVKLPELPGYQGGKVVTALFILTELHNTPQGLELFRQCWRAVAWHDDTCSIPTRKLD